MTAPTRIGSRTAGVDVAVYTRSRQWTAFARETCAGLETDPETEDVRVTVEENRSRFSHEHMQPLTRGAWSDGSVVVMEDACASGVDLRVRVAGERLEVTARHRPGWSTRALARAAPGRGTLLLRSAIVQYPALWWAGVAGAVPLHVSGVRIGGQDVVLAGPGGVGKSTLLEGAVASGGLPVSDNLCVGDGVSVHGLLEPVRSDGGAGRRMPHGRRESPWVQRLDGLTVERILVLRRGTGLRAVVTPMHPASAARVLTAGTYAAGELRRYWAFAATLALGTGLGPAHPPLAQVAEQLCRSVPCVDVLLPSTPGTRVVDLLAEARLQVAELEHGQ